MGQAGRRGKYLWLPIGAQVLVLHFRMTGKLVEETDGPRAHARLRLHRRGGQPLAFVDTRRLGRVWMLEAGELGAFFDAIPLGPEPWPEVRDGAWWQRQVAGLRGSVKGALMNQWRVAGLGNIAASEICFRAGIDPRSLASALGGDDWGAVAVATHGFIEHVLACESGPEIAYLSEGRAAANPFSVYARAGERCGRCSSVIARSVQAGRSTFCCSGCQTLIASGDDR
jgi:formamidopyrimidine-DNA glycosylase